MSEVEGWDTAFEAADNAGGGQYLSIKSGEEYDLVFLGNPIVDKKVWSDAEGTYVPYDPDKHSKYSTKFLCNVINRTQNDAHQIYEFGVMVMKDLKANFAKRKPSDWSFMVSREGEGKNTEYKVILGDQLEDDEKEKYQATELYDLEPELCKNKQGPAANAAAPEEGEEVPF